MTRHLFRISAEAWRAADFENVRATVEALKEADLYALPYDDIDIEAPVDCAVIWTGPPVRDLALNTVYNDDGTVRGYRSTFGDGVVVRATGVTIFDDARIATGALIVDYNTKLITPFLHTDTPLAYTQRVESLAKSMRALLIALLYTKNAVKVTKQNKLAKLGIGKKRPDAKYEYVTTIRPPATRDMPDDEEHPPLADTPGEPTRKCPHLRRAHWRQQRFGPGRSYVKAILIQAMFINADREWTKTRTAYNVSL